MASEAVNAPAKKVTKAAQKRAESRVRKVREKLMARLIASEYLRNGLRMKDAYESVTGKRYTSRAFHSLIDADSGAFMKEIDNALVSADIEKNKVLGLLWAQATTSPLDFMDDDGVILPIAELKKLPREFQALIEEVKVFREEKPAKDEEGNILRNDDGSVQMTTVERVQLKFPSKQNALNTIAQIGKLIGPTSVTNNNYNFVANIGQLMVDADNRRASLLGGRETRVIEHEGDGS